MKQNRCYNGIGYKFNLTSNYCLGKRGNSYE